ncbi:hypothetical protein B0H17DRAFT_94477 [Mycena rosella]|uniref:Proteophosphoglycan ppg4 n=1 Tax=Mycena rosella TaxID=1033263 RepID=A0AAD7DZA3_MYCRO|nr:hypothetical protein B0H17DRAFT_94477 [Mycena rosella]
MAALVSQRLDAGSSSSPAVFHRALRADPDSRYPSPRAASIPTPEPSRSYSPNHAATAPPDVQSLKSNQSQEPPRSVVSYALPPGAARRVVERYSLEDTAQRAPSRASAETRPTALESNQDPPNPLLRQSPSQELPASLLPSAPRHPALPAGAGSSRTGLPNFTPPIMPLSASPGYNPPVSPNPRAYAHQPTYITPPPAPRPVALSTPPQEEVCVECAMRDQDMIDVDVTTPGVWERESDAVFEDLLRRELEDEASGVVVDDPSRPPARGGLLTEQNLKAWLSNPREPASRQMTLNTYIKSQHTLLEAEALARARAMQEAKQLDNRMRDTYSQLRRSAYDTGNSSTPADDSGGVRIKPPRSPSSPNHPGRSHSREVTLLENGMIVEHVDVRKEEKEARERRRKEEKRARKSSRSSVIDVNSIISTQSFNPSPDNGLKPYSRYSQASSARPTSVVTAPLDRSELPRAYSQASFSDIHSLGSASPRRTRFFGIKNLSAGWRSQDSLAPSGISGSMMDMHVALQNEAYGQRVSSPVDLNTARRSQLWPAMDQEAQGTQTVQDQPKKKKKGFAKIWGIVTGSSKQQNASREPSQSYERTEDDGPLAPPPPLSYLVNRGRASDGGRHASTPSLPSLTSPKVGMSSQGMSPPTAPSSILPSPASSRGPDVGVAEQRNSNGTYDEDQHPSDDTIGKSQSQTVGTRNVHPVTSEPDMRRASQSPPPTSGLSNGFSNGASRPRPDSVMSFRDKSLPPLPMEAFAPPPEARPRTVMSFNRPPGSAPAHDFLPPQAPFRTSEVRRQSFGGLSSRPALALQTVPATQPVAFDQRRPFGPRYDEYGLSRRSLGRLDNVQEHPAVRNSSAPTATKRRSRFGLSSLLGRKSSQNKIEAVHEAGAAAQTFPAMRRSGSEGADDFATGYATSTSRHSAFSMGGPRMSVTSRKALEDLVAQDPDFVAYRYPSNDQHLDILR